LKEAEKKAANLLETVEPEDLMKYGLIPEFIGRLPVVATLMDLDEAALIRILTEPKNALVKQYQKLLSFDNVKLKFTEGALAAVAKKAVDRKAGARGLRSILEDVMLDIMYEIPSKKEVAECIVNEEAIQKKEKPLVVYHKKAESA
jgi:ATP-dependent Clp protease ATP-binding subunit ClpX